VAKKKQNTIGRGRALTQFQKEMIVQAYALCGNKSQVAREIGCSANTVHNVIREAESNRALQDARRRALDDVAGQLHGKAVEVIASIVPEDMESGLIKKYDEADPEKLVSVKAYGPSLLQKVTSAAILTDKLKVVQETKAALTADNENDPMKLPMPDDVQGALKMLGAKIKRLRVLDVQFDRTNPEAASKVQDVAHAAELNKHVEEADYEDLKPLDFDNP